MSKIKKLFKISFWTVLILIVLVNLLILISGKTYIYSAVAKTYFQGDKGPTIYDQDKFPQRIVKSGPNTFSFVEGNNQLKLTDTDLSRLANIETTSLLIIKNDTIVFEKYWEEHSAKTKSNSFSVAKSLIAILIGCAIEEGKIKSLDDSIGDYIPEFKNTEHNKITIRHLLSMSSGLKWIESGKNPLSHNAEAYFGSDLDNLILNLEVESEPGKELTYKSGNTQILAMILRKVTGKNISEYASEKVWSKIGTESDAIWNLDSEDGNEKAYCCLYATTADYAKLGRLLLNKGRYNGIQIVSSSFIEELITPQDLVEEDGSKNDRYGLHWWLYPRNNEIIYYARGIQGQFIIVIPKDNIIIVRTGHLREQKFGLEIKEGDYLETLTGHPTDLEFYIQLAKRI